MQHYEAEHNWKSIKKQLVHEVRYESIASDTVLRRVVALTVWSGPDGSQHRRDGAHASVRHLRLGCRHCRLQRPSAQRFQQLRNGTAGRVAGFWTRVGAIDAGAGVLRRSVQQEQKALLRSLL